VGSVHRRTGPDAWEGVEGVGYEDPAIAGVVKHELIGPAEGAPHYRLRHFSVPAGGRTARESHPDDHGVVILSGRARVTLGAEQEEVGPGDAVYVAGDELHCFEALGAEPLRFICVSPPREPRH
jgi:quercetin dioxygenase-like cupin family protein